MKDRDRDGYSSRFVNGCDGTVYAVLLDSAQLLVVVISLIVPGIEAVVRLVCPDIKAFAVLFHPCELMFGQGLQMPTLPCGGRRL